MSDSRVMVDWYAKSKTLIYLPSFKNYNSIADLRKIKNSTIEV